MRANRSHHNLRNKPTSFESIEVLRPYPHLCSGRRMTHRGQIRPAGQIEAQMTVMTLAVVGGCVHLVIRRRSCRVLGSSSPADPLRF